MMERRRHQRVPVDYWASLKHPLLGAVSGDIQDMSISGLSLKLDQEMSFYVMMELDVRIHGDGWDTSVPPLPVEVVRVSDREVALRFLESCEDHWVPPSEQDDDRQPLATAGESETRH